MESDGLSHYKARLAIPGVIMALGALTGLATNNYGIGLVIMGSGWLAFMILVDRHRERPRWD